MPNFTRNDIFGGLTAAIVALPLALAFGVASGAGALAGLYGAVIVGFFAAVFGGTPSQISGPTGPMTVVMAAVLTHFSGDPVAAFSVVMLGGLFQMLFGLSGIGRYIKLVPYPVVSGFMTGIGAIIIILQIPAVLGHALPAGIILVKLAALPALLSTPDWPSVILASTTLAVMYGVPNVLARLVPPPLIALLVGSVMAVWLFPQAAVIGAIPHGLPDFIIPQLSLSEIPHMVRFALVLAFLGSIDSLLTSLVADGLTATQHDSNRELFGQGIGNFLAGLFGAIPGAGATMRTVVNVRAGGRSRASGAVHALVLAALVLGFSGLVEHVPLAVLAGILLRVGIDIIDWRYLKRIHRAPRAGVIIMLVTLALTVLVDLVTAVATGVVMACVLFVARMADAQIQSVRLGATPAEFPDLNSDEAAILAAADGRIVLFQVEGPLSFGSARDVSRILRSSQHRDVLVIDLGRVPFIDSSASMALEDAINELQGAGKRVILCAVAPAVARVLERIGVLAQLPVDCVVSQRRVALVQARAGLA